MPAPVNLNIFSPKITLPSPWNTFIKGGGALEATGPTLRLVTRNCTARRYTDAQIDDYQQFRRAQFLWRPPLTMTVTARFSHPAGELRGTAGFGFWNDPFMMTGNRRPALPRAIWFFYSSPPSNMKLDLKTPGPGWKAATIDAIRWPFFALLPLAPLAVPLMNVEPLYRLCWPLGQRAIGVCERQVEADLTAWHTYCIEWRPNSARFAVDGQPLLATDTSPGGPLGFVMWLDNQFMMITPWGSFGHGLIDAPGEQWLETRHIEIVPG